MELAKKFREKSQSETEFYPSEAQSEQEGK